MATVNIDSEKNSNKDIERLLKEVAQLKMPDFEGFLKRALKILEKRKSPEYQKKEKELINKIKNGGPSKEWNDRYDKLSARVSHEEITESEHQDLLTLIPISEQWAYDRLVLMIELADLWDVPLEEVLKRLKIKPRTNIYA